MAIWQTDIQIVRKNVEALVKKEDDKLLVWEKQEITTRSLSIIENILPQKASWSKDILQYGDLDETCLEIYFSGNEISSILLRVDVRSATKELLATLLEFINAICGSMLFEKKIYTANLDNMKKILTISSAYAYCKDPQGFINGIKVKKNKGGI